MIRVLIPLDGTEASLRVIDGAITLLGSDRIDVSLLVCQPDQFKGAPEDLVEILEEQASHGIVASAQHLRAVEADGMARCEMHGVTPNLLESHDTPLTAILAAAKDHDVLAMHALDPRRFSADLHGSQGGKLARRAPCHVLLIGEQD